MVFMSLWFQQFTDYPDFFAAVGGLGDLEKHLKAIAKRRRNSKRN